METFTSHLYSQMQQDLQDISLNNEDTMRKAEQSYYAIEEYLRKLKIFARDYSFKSKEEEIRFFKEIKPLFLKEMIFFIKLYDIETRKPVGTPEALINYYKSEIEKLQAYFERNRFLFLYYRMDKIHLDSMLFVREPADIELFPVYSLENDPTFSNVYSHKRAKFQAYEDIVVFIKAMIADPEGASVPNHHPVTFTGSKAQFIELAYSLQTSGVLNNGKATVKEAFDWLQYAFNIKVSNYYGYFQSMRIRKKNRTPFIGLLSEMLTRRMDESDEFPRYS